MEHFDDDVDVIRAHELEGVVYTRLDAPYRPPVVSAGRAR
jgi:hypothetical protein